MNELLQNGSVNLLLFLEVTQTTPRCLPKRRQMQKVERDDSEPVKLHLSQVLSPIGGH